MRLILAILLVCRADQSAAHGLLDGGAGFYAGATHPFVAMEHLVTLIALGLLVGRLRDHHIGLATLFLLAGLLVGVLSQTGFSASTTTMLFVCCLIFGVVLTARLSVTPGLVMASAAVVGVLVGATTDVFGTMTAPLTVTALAALGLVVGAQAITLNAAALSFYTVQKGWSIVPRVAGSWITAVAVLALTLWLTGVTGVSRDGSS